MTAPKKPGSAPAGSPPSSPSVDWSSRFGGALIAPDGREIPITDSMIREACLALEQQAFIGLHSHNPAR